MTSQKNIHIRFAEQIDRQKWDSFVHTHSDATPYHLYGWGEAIEKVYGFTILRILVEKENQLVGILPVVNHSIPLISNMLVSMPYCDLGYPLATSREVSVDLAKHVIEIAKKRKIDGIELRNMDEQLVIDTAHKFERMTGKVRMLLDLPESSEVLWAGFKSKLRSQVRKAEKNNLHFEFGHHHIDAFYSVFCRNMHSLGSPVHAKKFIEEIISQMGEHAWIGVVFHNALPIGAGIILQSGKNMFIPWASTLREYNNLNPNMLLYWSFLQFAADNGNAQFDFGRSTPDEGTYRFKAQWGAKPHQLIWHKIILKDKESSESHGESKYRNKAEQIWQKMPLSVANFLGPLVRRYITL